MDQSIDIEIQEEAGGKTGNAAATAAYV